MCAARELDDNCHDDSVSFHFMTMGHSHNSCPSSLLRWFSSLWDFPLVVSRCVQCLEVFLILVSRLVNICVGFYIFAVCCFHYLERVSYFVFAFGKHFCWFLFFCGLLVSLSGTKKHWRLGPLRCIFKVPVRDLSLVVSPNIPKLLTRPVC